jgi:hypothetical protein
MGAHDLERNVQSFEALLQPGKQAIHEFLKDGRFDQGVVADDVNRPATVVGSNAADRFEDAVQQQRGILPAGEPDDPGVIVRREVFVAEVMAKGLEFGGVTV